MSDASIQQLPFAPEELTDPAAFCENQVSKSKKRATKKTIQCAQKLVEPGHYFWRLLEQLLVGEVLVPTKMRHKKLFEEEKKKGGRVGTLASHLPSSTTSPLNPN